MKTTAFLIRVAICLLLSLIPVTELENHIYSGRMALRKPSSHSKDFLVVRMSSEESNDPATLKRAQERILSTRPKLLIVTLKSYLVGLHPDNDGLLRRASLSSSMSVRGAPSLAFLAKQALEEGVPLLNPESGNTVPLKGIVRPFLSSSEFSENPAPQTTPWMVPRLGRSYSKTPAPLSGFHLINFLGPPGSIPTCSLSEFEKDACQTILHPGARDPDFQQQIIFLSNETDLSPSFHTPLGDMSQTEVLVHDLYTVALQHPIYQISFLGTLIMLLSVILIGALCIVYFPVVTSAIAISSTGLVLVLGLFQLLFDLFSIYFPSGNLICSLLITYLIFTGYRLAFQENLQWRSLKQSQYLRELDRMKTNFLSLVSHDLKTPLAKIQAIMERMRRELSLPPEQRSDWKELIDSIENSNNEMKHYITSILNLSKIESQKVILNKKSNDINLLIQQAIKRLKPLAAQKGIKFDEYLEPLFSIECDEDLMRQVLTNLIDNAIKYSPPNSKIIVRSREEEGFVRVEVEDFGPGIPKDQLPLMFRKFGRYLQPIKEQVKGTGLGLYLSKYFIEIHGGSIRVKSIEGSGTVFSFTLPLNNMENESILC